MKIVEADQRESLCAQVAEAFAAERALRIEGGGSKGFYGREGEGETLSLAGHSGIIDYEPSELVISARAGTPLHAIETLLEAHGQMLAFEPPHFGPAATIGGTVACGLSGPRRPWSGAVRDFVLGVGMINGKGEALAFGGRVIKNVAGYDLSRLMSGALGTLGVVTEVSLKVLPRPPRETSVQFELDAATAIERCNQWAGQPVPLSAACYADGRLSLRLCGTEQGVARARARLGGEELEHADDFWVALREHRLPFFRDAEALWRLGVAPATAPLELSGRWLIDWGGAQRWLSTPETATDIRRAASAVGGHATLFRGGDRRSEVFQPLGPPLLALHRRLKQALDPAGILNPGRLYAAF